MASMYEDYMRHLQPLIDARKKAELERLGIYPDEPVIRQPHVDMGGPEGDRSGWIDDPNIYSNEKIKASDYPVFTGRVLSDINP